LTSGKVQLTTHWLPWQTLPTEHVTPHPPQLALSAEVSTHAVPHFVNPPLQPKPQVLAVHSGKPFWGGGRQLAPHAPQFGSLVGSTQVLPHLIEPALQVKPHSELEQYACPPGGAGQA
jgi:hypothetical protein